MEIFKLLQQKSRRFYFSMIVFGLINGLWNMSLLSIINTTIQGSKLPFLGDYHWQLFLMLVIISLISNKVFQNFMIRLTNELSYQLGVSVLDKLRFASYQDFQDLGQEKVYAALQDAQQLSIIPRTFIEAFNAVIIVTCCFAYLMWISPVGGFLLLGVVAFIVAFFVYRNRLIEKDFNIIRDLQNNFFAYLQDLLSGFKEVKMGTSRNDTLFHKFIDKNRFTTKELLIKNQFKYVNNDLIGNYSLYLVIGLVLFVLPAVYNLGLSQMTTFIMAILYAIGPITMLINIIPTYTRVKISVERINSFDHQLKALKMGKIKHGTPLLGDQAFQSIRFENVVYQYYDKAQRTFELGPINLEIRRGELIFITGGNGSGKSTFSNLLTGLYKPTSGKIYLNEQEVSDETYPDYRNQISAIFTDNHLFSENYDEFDLSHINQDFKEYLNVMRLAEVIRYNPEGNKVDKNLSKGQGKRLSMIFSQLENRDVWVLDEWAADQDPEFREYFYKVHLQTLKEAGKTVIVITHDDQYFQFAERKIKFDFGQIVRDEIQAPVLLEEKQI